MMRKFQYANALKLIEQEKCTVFHGVPTMYKRFLDNYENYSMSSLEKCFIAGASCDTNLILDIINKLKVKKLYAAYGQTETLGVTLIDMVSAPISKIKSVGRTVKYVQAEVSSNGEILIRTPFMMKEYFNDKYKTNKVILEDGWIRTGDLGYIDNDGYITVTGRIKELINKGGEKIAPLEIENALLQHKVIKEAAVIGIPDEDMGENIYAFIAIDESYSLSESEVKEFLLTKISKFKIPKYIEILKCFPLTPSGKISKNQLKDILKERKFYNMK